jgi:hypothetical protein
MLSLALGVAASATAVAREVFVSGAAATGAVVAAVALISVRQWRFSPRPRARDAALVLASSVAVVAAYPSVALEGDVWALGILGTALAVCVVVSLPLLRLSELATISEDVAANS